MVLLQKRRDRRFHQIPRIMIIDIIAWYDIQLLESPIPATAAATSVTKSVKWQYLGNQAWYHIPSWCQNNREQIPKNSIKKDNFYFENGQKWSKWSSMVQNGSKWSNMVKNGENWWKMVKKKVKIDKNSKNRQK